MSTSLYERLGNLPYETQVDDTIHSIAKHYKKRAKSGVAKPGTSTIKEDLSNLEWIKHAQDELMDAFLYLERLKKVIQTEEEDETGTYDT